MFAWKSAALSPAATPLVDMDAPACTSTLPITASSFPCSMSFQGPGSQSFCFVCSASFVSSKACTDPSFLGTQLHAWPHAWHIVAPWSHSERCPAPEEPRQRNDCGPYRSNRTQHPKQKQGRNNTAFIQPSHPSQEQ